MWRYLFFGLLCLSSQSVFAGDNETVQGQGGRVLNYSSTQIRVEPSAEDIRNYQQARDRVLDGASLSAALQAGRRALQQLGYNRVDIDAEFGVIRAEKDEVLISQARQVLRGLLKLKFPLPGKPDHQTTELLLTLRNGAQARQIWLRAQMRQTIWDSNGNSRTLLLSDPASYGQVYDKLTAALNGQG
ncbi:hypothetical protein [Chromobacterium sp. IIBBL 290-4]|uniref:hypothetical protein n=1 Tax=Chromobacterium sp. IIBBL 290-4 TaxID=2953890 RepID=UPI0020B7884F|nr:hypothetical protein [Chromobacterium sp. IIBBL 290-4]UTH73613.1 hypothetical protein NKT35_19035 [Chromobacterium sp. IIBBL 290-4]